jgi:cytochrome c oxidase subunit 6b
MFCVCVRVAQVVTAPYDPRFPTTNQNRHCFIRYNEYYK